jgi:PAS domain S-box-containing protein
MPDRSHQEFSQRVLDHAASMLAYWGTDLRCRYANPGYLRWFGIASEDVIGKHMEALLGAEIYALDRPHIVAVLAGQPQVFESTVRGPDGVRRYGLARYHPDVDHGVVIGFTAEVSDLTPFKTLELALMEGMALKEHAIDVLEKKDRALEAAQRLGKIGSWEWEAACDITTWSPELYRVFGMDPGRLPPAFSEHAALYTPASWERLRDAVATALTSGQPYHLQLAYLRPGGAQGWLDIRGEVARDSAGAVAGLRGTAQDVTAMHTLMALLRDQAQRLDLALAASELGLLRWHAATGALGCENERARAIFGVEHGAVPADEAGFCAHCLHPDDIGAFRAALSACAQGGARFRFKGRSAPRAGEEPRWIDCAGELLDAGQESAYLICTVADVTASMSASQAFQRAVSALTESETSRNGFLAMIGHELRNGMASITAGAQLLALEPGPVTARTIHAAMLRQVGHLHRLIEDIEKAGAARTLGLELRCAPVALDNVVRDATDMVRAAMDRAGHCLTVEMPSAPVLMDGDPVRLTQVLVNLLCNAVKFTPDHGSISIALRAQTPALAVIVVTDNGIGIPPDQLDAIFGMYVQLHAPASHADDGLGIGLSLARQLVQRHGGTLDAYSAGVGHGCTMTVRLPLGGTGSSRTSTQSSS